MELVQVNEGALAAFGQAAAALSGDNKPILKFDKGDWYLGQNKEEVSAGTKFALNMMDAHWGWLLWRDKKVDDRKMVPVASGQAIAARSDLGHLDEALWERGQDGKSIDPWSKTIEIPAREIDGELREVVLSGSSKGWEGCCKQLFKQFGEQMRANAGKVPVIELGTGKYQHPQYGVVKVPTLNIVEWRSLAELEASAPAAPAPKGKQTKF